MAQIEALRLAREDCVPRDQFRASRGWFRRFMKRHEFSIRRRMTLCQRLPDIYEEKLVNFQRYMIGLRKRHEYLYSQIGIVDQTPVYLEMPLDTTLQKKGSKSVSILTGGNSKLRCTVMLCALADGMKLRLSVIFKCKTLPTDLPSGIVVRAEDNSWMNSHLVVDWVKTV
ncbi:hypothetical protein HPB47_010906 [Ixodes persulcatus]|uniref:Uncharacterized protein n=1 Tax=Ixodes persulcatus TaxID=34615 RepID=A0AC60NXR8_IXOPE|nr:hypothetical protein HPB47_010906 [Ixodes persulcatus]